MLTAKQGKGFFALVVGIFLTTIYMQFIDWGAATPVPDILQPYPDFPIHYFSSLVTGFVTALISFFTIKLACNRYKLRESKHLMLLLLPTLGYLAYTFMVAQMSFTAILYALIPAAGASIIAFNVGNTEA
ncbi:hypothetical protein E2K93_08110 [Thalassotalea sp. HSM 43]|uniref:hypothetical protein n=1 Tax=Thalassotalea sp. HSM 43 TaxID=2552945 RepID=UPI0010820AB6|nr:hypothetical protein [Thalassotalea sp. HSM 43]QBY04355.1 hypothetical protein E2K93_08110 [Thalassotalea sp. HSM 43]